MQVGMDIIMFNSSPSAFATETDSLGCDDTFNIVNSTRYEFCFDLNTIFCEQKTTELVFAVIRHLYSRKTQGARKVLMAYFVNVLYDNGISGPLSPSCTVPMSIATEFETTYAIALRDALIDKFKSGCSMDYVRKVCFRC